MTTDHWIKNPDGSYSYLFNNMDLGKVKKATLKGAEGWTAEYRNIRNRLVSIGWFSLFKEAKEAVAKSLESK